MACGDPIPAGWIIYRALSKKYIDVDAGGPADIAFQLKPAHDDQPDETYLSFGVSQAGAEKYLSKIKGFSEIRVADLIAMGFTVCEDDDPVKVRVAGMPLPTADPGVALLMAKRIRDKSKLCSS
jgi:hypothetical protein